MEKWNTSSSRLHSLGRDNHIAYASGLVPKNLDKYTSPPSTIATPERLIRRIGEFDIGTALHNLVALIAEEKYTDAEAKVEAIRSSSRWKMSYGKGTDTVANFMASAALEMVGRVREGREDIILVPEQKVMASSKARTKTADVLTTDADSASNLIRFPLEQSDNPLVPLTVHPLLHDEVGDTDPVGDARFLVYGVQAIPDLLGFLPKTSDAKKLIRPLMQLMYQDNEGTRRYLLNPDLLQANKELLQQVLQTILEKELHVTIFEMKTAPWRGSSVTDKPDELLFKKYSSDISHTVLALLQIFKAVSPSEFKGRNQLRTMTQLLQGTSVQLGLVDFPALLNIAGQAEPIVPTVGSVNTRLLTVPSEKVREGCIRRMLLNEQHFRKMTPPAGFVE